MNEVTPLPSEVRAQVLEHHADLREQMIHLEEAAHQTLESPAHRDVLYGALTNFLQRLSDHMHYEDRVLKKVLAEADPWGPERVARFERDHDRQRGWIDRLPEEGAARASDELAFLTLGFLKVLERDMEEEERDVLSAELLKDDPVVVHPEPE